MLCTKHGCNEWSRFRDKRVKEVEVHHMPYPEDFDNTLRMADPIGGASLETQSIETALDEMGERLMSLPIPASHWRTRAWRPRFTRRILIVGAASLLVVTAAGAASILTARTGERLPAKYVQAGGPGELLRTWAPDFCRVVLAGSFGIEYPTGYENWRLNVLTFEDGIAHPSATGNCHVTQPSGKHLEVTKGAERGVFAMGAFCAWVSDFKSATQSGNSSEAVIASREVAGATAWPAVRAEDPHPTRGTVFGFFLPFQREVAAGNSTQVARALVRPQNGCAGFIPNEHHT